MSGRALICFETFLIRDEIPSFELDLTEEGLRTGTTRRSISLQPREQMQALFAACKREETDEFKDIYRHRAGIKGTHS